MHEECPESPARDSRYIFMMCLPVPIFFIGGKLTDVYRWRVLGALYEILWLPGVAFLFALLLYTSYSWYKVNFRSGSQFLYALIILSGTVCFMIFF